MNKSAIQAYTEWAKVELTNAVKQKAFEYGITETSISEADDVANGRVLNRIEQKQRSQLVSEIKEKGYKNVIEEVTYTWFNRFIALRFMEVNGYLPSHTRVFSDDENKFNPQILKEALTVEIDGLDREIIVDYLDKNNSEGLFKYLIISQCNALNKIIPVLFEKISNYTELLFPNNLLKKDSVLDKLVNDIPEEDWKDQVQILGWLYQFYVAMNREDFRKVKVVKKEHIPTLSQIFTPDWIVRYMAENSVGRLWLESYPNSSLRKEMQYYVEDVPQTEEVNKQLQEIKYKDVNPENIHVIEPCCGSGHILVYVFDLLAKMYEEKGYKKSDIPTLILRNNLVGLDIDKRASQLAYFSLVMKARSLDSRLFSRDELTHPRIFEIVDSESIFDDDYESIMESHHFSSESINTAKYLAETFRHAKVIGSLLLVNKKDYHSFISELKEKKNIENWNIFETHFQTSSIDLLIRLARLAIVMSDKYDVMITNPPYLNSGSLEPICKDYAVKHYHRSKTDMFAMFMEIPFVKKNGFRAMVNPDSWMFLVSFELLRKEIISKESILTLAHLGLGAFDATVQTVIFVFRNTPLIDNGSYIRLFNSKNKSSDVLTEKRIITSKTNFGFVPSYLFAYWLEKEFLDAFKKYPLLGTVAEVKQGLATADNNRFLRLWTEVDYNKIKFNATSCSDSYYSGKKWFPYNKGGLFRKWYGNNDFVVNWEKDGKEIRNNFDERGKLLSVPRNTNFYFKESISWSLISSSVIHFRYKPIGHVFDVAGMSCFSKDYLFYLMALCNTKLAMKFLEVLAPTLNYQCGDIAKIPVNIDNSIKQEVDSIVSENIDICKKDWDDSELSWDFVKNPIIGKGRIESLFANYLEITKNRFLNLKSNEERINKIFNHIYGVENILDNSIEDKHVTVRIAEKKLCIKQLISYFVGCVFGRYSPEKEGLIFAGGKFELNQNVNYKPDADNIIPICDDEYFDDDMTCKFLMFIKNVFGEENFEENIKFIASSLGGNGIPREVIREYFVSGFYNDHIKTYKKRPIYWLFDSGKKNGFKALIYMHRYSPDLLAKMRTDYVHEQQERYRTQIANLESEVLHLDGMEKSKANKRLAKLKDQLIEINEFEEKIHHLADQMIEIDLDDGVKVNYAKFQDVLAPIK